MSLPAPSADRYRKFLYIWGPPAVLALVIFIGSAIPGSEIPPYPEVLNNIIHFMEFAALGFLLARALDNIRISFRKFDTVLWTTVICSAYGLVVEFYQFTVPNRVFDVADLGMDAAGALAGSVLYGMVRNRGSRNPDERSSPPKR